MKGFTVLFWHCAGRIPERQEELLLWEELVKALSHPLSIKRNGLWVIKCSLCIYWNSKRLGQPGDW